MLIWVNVQIAILFARFENRAMIEDKLIPGIHEQEASYFLLHWLSKLTLAFPLFLNIPTESLT